MKVTIGTLVYDVSKMSDSEANATGAWGLHMPRDEKILLDPTLTSQRERVTLVHEVFHALLSQGGYGGKDESLIDYLAMMILKFFDDNHDIMFREGSIFEKDPEGPLDATDQPLHSSQ